LNIKAKKRFGQNFLKDVDIVNKIIKAIPNDNYKLVEIGAGLGDLTKYLLESQDVVAFEIDLELCQFLKNRFSEELKSGRLKLICEDVLEFWRFGLLFDEDYKIVANLPYYVATKIILKALDDNRCQNITVMIQKEVADKFLAEVEDRDFGALSVIAQSVGDIQHIVDVPPSAFEPQPKVNSSVIQFRKFRDTPSKEFKKFLQIAFRQPRKTLIKNLSQRYNRENLEELLNELALNHSIRPHQVDSINYHQIFDTLEGLRIGRERRTVEKT